MKTNGARRALEEGVLAAFVLVVLAALAAGCSPSVASGAPPAQSQNGGDDGSPSAPSSGDARGPGGESAPTATISGPLAIVAIDPQQVFFDTAKRRNPKLDVDAIQATTAHLFTVASEHHVPRFVTFEETKSGDHALPPALASSPLGSANQFVKTTFDATGQPELLAALKGSGAKRIVVVGAETDVCVMQSALGLRRAGFDVITVHDALFTEEVNTAPAMRRMRQAGIVDVAASEAEALLASGGDSPAPAETRQATTVHPFAIGIVLADLQGVGESDPNASPKSVRLRQLLLVSEWFELPLFAVDPAAATAALPADMRSILTRPITALAARPSSVKQMAVAGARDAIGALAADLAKDGDVFVLDDTLVGVQPLEPLYAAGAMPSTYKSLYYELIHSVNQAEWPSQQWVADGDRYYYDATMAPEDLPPLTE